MNILESLRPETRRLDADWSATTLEAILAESPGPASAKRPRRRRLTIAAAAAVGLIGVGGVAYASGLVPQSVLEAFADLDEQSGETFDVSGVKPIADFTVPDGTRYTVWRGMNAAGGSCEAIREDRPEDKHDGLDVGCFSGDSANHYEQLNFSWVQLPEKEGQPQNPMYYVAYGEASSGEASSVRVSGDGTDVTFPVDPVNLGFGGNLPGYTAIPGQLPELTFTFRDKAGNVVDTQSPWE